MTLLGCIADDLMGGVELATILTRRGMRTVLLNGIPAAAAPEADALVVTLDSRRAPVRQARADSLTALDWLRAAGCRQFFFCYARTFESTDDGNIGPVADGLVDALGCGFALACPAAPAAGYTVYQGHLFAGASLRGTGEANLVRALSRQTDGMVGLTPFATVAAGPEAIRRGLLAQKEQGRRYAIVDALTEADLLAIGTAAAGQTLITGAPGLASGLPANFRAAGLLRMEVMPTVPEVSGHAAVLAGSCTRATLFQLGYARGQLATLELDPLAVPDASLLTAQALSWAERRLGETPVVIATSAPPDSVAALRAALGREAADALVEDALAGIAAGLVALGVRRLVVAGSGTAAAVLPALGVQTLRIGIAIETDVAWSFAEGTGPALMLALKPGDAGGRGVFGGAFQMLSQEQT